MDTRVVITRLEHELAGVTAGNVALAQPLQDNTLRGGAVAGGGSQQGIHGGIYRGGSLFGVLCRNTDGLERVDRGGTRGERVSAHGNGFKVVACAKQRCRRFIRSDIGSSVRRRSAHGRFICVGTLARVVGAGLLARILNRRCTFIIRTLSCSRSLRRPEP